MDLDYNENEHGLAYAYVTQRSMKHLRDQPSFSSTEFKVLRRRTAKAVEELNDENWIYRSVTIFVEAPTNFKIGSTFARMKIIRTTCCSIGRIRARPAQARKVALGDLASLHNPSTSVRFEHLAQSVGSSGRTARRISSNRLWRKRCQSFLKKESWSPR